MADGVVERFLRYVQIDTRSDENSDTCPSTQKQLKLAELLVAELKELGLEDAKMDANGYVTATLHSNLNPDSDRAVPTIGFIAHMDTSPDISGEGVKPRIIENYDGNDIVLNKEMNIILSPEDFPELNNYIGQDIITTDGTTLLGADDKAGIAEIMAAVEFLAKHPEIKHGTIKVAFTPDEEIGRGADRFDVAGFGADFAYTVDGGEIGELEYENFNAAAAKIRINGRNVHPGSAKGKMKNAILIGMELNSMLPATDIPSATEGYEGFYHLNGIRGTVDSCTLYYIIRDHDMSRFTEKKERLCRAVRMLNEKYGPNTVMIEMNDQYYNMKEKILPVINIVNAARTAMEEVGIIPRISPVRGGTDGAKLSFMGLPTPNLFTGGHNFHGRYEYIPIQSMEKAVQVILKIITLFAEGKYDYKTDAAD